MRGRAGLCFLLVFALGATLRLAGLTRGTSDFVLPEAAQRGVTTAFYTFHPDEEMVVRAALQPLAPLAPAFTVYGSLPVYVLRGALQWLLPPDPQPPPALEDPAFARPVYLTARVVAVLFSCLALGLTWALGARWFGRPTACLAAGLVALAPGAIQQAHFYVVDGLFAALSLAALWAILHSRAGGRVGWTLAAGALIGATASVKLLGLLLLGVLGAAHCDAAMRAGQGPWPRRLLAPLRDPALWAAAALAVAVLLAFEPYLVADPNRILQTETIGDFRMSAAIAQGEYLRLWTLADVHTTRYLHHWTRLFPLIAGWPLTAAFLAGLAHALRRRGPADVVLLTWFALYFGSVGGLHAKHVRYLIPLVPVLSLLAADLLWHLRPRRWGWLPGAAVLAATTVYGLAFARIYAVEDSRIQAARWLDEHVPAGGTVGVEAGGFTLRGLISNQRYNVRPIGEGRCFGARRYLSCGATFDHLRRQLRGDDLLAIADANRYLQFTAVPELMPAAAEFYRRLVDGRLGFDVVHAVRAAPHVAGLELAPPRPETSFIGYDHPTVYLLRRRPDFEAVWQAWWQDLAADPRCPDGALAPVAAAIQAGDPEAIARQAAAAAESHPDLLLTSLLAAYGYARLGDTAAETAARDRYTSGCADPSQICTLIPWASCMTLIRLRLFELVPTVLQAGRRHAGNTPPEHLANTYREVGDALTAGGQSGLAAYAYESSAQLQPTPGIYALLGGSLADKGEMAASTQAYLKALEQNPQDHDSRLQLAWNRYVERDYAAATELNRQVLAAGPSAVAMCNLGLVSLASGQTAAGEAWFRQAVAQFGAAELQRIGAEGFLRELAARGVATEAVARVLGALQPDPASRR